jgi:uncharacterized membrane protein YhaH (DUF805 family)
MDVTETRRTGVPWWRLLFDRTRLGCVGRGPYWSALGVHVTILALAFVLPFEALFRLEVEPDSPVMTLFLYGWLLFSFVTFWCLLRLTGRRLSDAGFSRAWRWLVLLPVLGWGVLLVMLLMPTRHKQEPLR